jgi:DNA-binding CsgD family transcriptional regulator
MPTTALEDIFVMLCDWRGRCVWVSADELPVKIGAFVWEQLTAESQQATKVALGQVVTAREAQQLEVVDQKGDRFRGWLWPLDSPNVAVCVLGMRVPRNLALLTKRERECLELLAQGITTRQIAEQLDISINTVHTHMRGAREKLGLRSVEALISFSARYYYPAQKAFGDSPS